MSTSSTSSATSSGSTPTNSNPSGDGGTSNSLYLFTFLTTLLLLLAVSCGIVLRSFILRRRFRRRVEAAIAAGVLLPEQVEALRRRGPALGEKPKIWEVRIDKVHKEGYEAGSASITSPNPADDDWSKIMPVAAAIIPGRSSTPAPFSANTNATTDESSDLSTARTSRRNGAFWPFGRRRTRPEPPVLPVTATQNDQASGASAPEPGTSDIQSGDSVQMSDMSKPKSANADTADVEAQDRLQVTVIIAMPNPNSRWYTPPGSSEFEPPSPSSIKGKEPYAKKDDEDDEEEDEIPEVVLGVTEVLWEQGSDWKPRAEEEKRTKGDSGKTGMSDDTSRS